MSAASRDLLGVEFGDLMLRASGLPFGVLQAPSYYTLANRVATNVVNSYGLRCLLYIGISVLC